MIQPDADAQLLQSILQAMIKAKGRGGASWAARKLGISPSSLHKRMESAEGAFDAPTLRAALLIMASRSDRQTTKPVKTKVSGKFIVEFHQTEDGEKIAWKAK